MNRSTDQDFDLLIPVPEDPAGQFLGISQKCR
jgi:hypothetical protein